MAEKRYIEIKGAKVHNLKNISLDIPHGELVLFTGLSGSGKSSLAFDTIYAEGHRRYVESLSSYARQFLGRITKPNVDKILGIAPSIAIEQKVSAKNPRSTVGTTTEIYDYLRLLFAKVGHIYSPITGEEIVQYNPVNVLEFILNECDNKKLAIVTKVDFSDESTLIERITWYVGDGFDRFYVDNMLCEVSEIMANLKSYLNKDIFMLVDRMRVNTKDEQQISRINESLELCFGKFHQQCDLIIDNGGGDFEVKHFSNSLERDGVTFELPTEHLFSFNSPIGACPQCSGNGRSEGIDEDLVVPDKTKSLFEDGIVCWRGESMKWWKEQVISSAAASGFPIHKPYNKLSAEDKKRLWNGCKYFEGINDFFDYLEKERYKIQNRFIMARYRGKRTCPECEGGRLRKEAQYIKVGGFTITDFVKMPISELTPIIEGLELSSHDAKIAERIIKEIFTRLNTMCEVGLEYLTLDRQSSTLSGGESQRINLATSLGSSLVGSIYILDEPSIGLHPRDTQRLISVLKRLRDVGNSVLVVEHDQEVISSADHIIDIGPKAGLYGGEVIYNGKASSFLKCKESLTAAYLRGDMKIERKAEARNLHNYIEINGARENNLKDIDVKIPLRAFTVVTGVSGSGKSSLVKKILYPALSRHFNSVGSALGNYKSLSGDIKLLKGVEMIDQNPIGRSSRSNPVTYIKAYDEIRKIYAEQHLAKVGGFTPSHFSFNIAGGRCSRCEGEGVIRVDMQFMADVEMVCEECNGRRFKDEVLQIKYRGKSIDEVLDMEIVESIEFFSGDTSSLAAKVVEKLRALESVGLGYVKLGQSSSTLSGGESQRVKLASFLIKENSTQPLIFIFDEPTTGLHFHDINNLLKAFDALVARGHTLVVVEHNMDVVSCADYVIDLGSEGGDKGGNLIFQGTFKDFCNCKDGYTSQYLKETSNGN